MERIVESSPHSQTKTIEALRARIGRLGGMASPVAHKAAIRFGLHTIDSRLPCGGLPAGALHEVLGQGPDTEHGTVASLLIGGLLAGLDPTRQVLWAMQGCDLFAPGLAAVGLHPQRLILAECGDAVLAVMEEALRHPGLVAVVGEVDGRLGLTASRRLQIAAASSGVTAFAIRRSRRFDDPVLLEASAAVSRWRVAAFPQSTPARSCDLPPGRALWRLELLRCREAAFPFHWMVQASDAQGHLADAVIDPSLVRHRSAAEDRLSLAALLADGPAQAQARGRLGVRHG